LDLVKVGGSLMEHAREVMAQLRAYDVLIVPGGGPFADRVREIQKEVRIEDAAAHRMAIMAMDQYGLMLSDVSGLPAYDSFEDVETPGIFLPSELLKKDDPFTPSWDVTSDTIACHIAHLAGAERFIILTDVDGIFVDGELVGEITASELKKLPGTCVDRALAGYLIEYGAVCQVVNGLDKNAVERALEGENAGTVVEGK
jgi:aspartokinase-like uncharacterized kinase